jgi:hypothetical protein
MRRLAKNDQDLRSVLVAILHTLFGGEPAWELKSGDEPSLTKLFERATGTERAKTDPLFSEKPLLSADANVVEAIEDTFHQGVFNLDDPGWAIRRASDIDLERARGQARVFLQGLPAAAHIVAARYTRDYGGLGMSGVIDLADPTIVAVMVQLSLLLRQLSSTDEEKKSAAESLDALTANVNIFTCAELMRSELPQYRFLLRPDRDARLASMTSEERELIARTVDDFMRRHPECLPELTNTE